MPGLRSVVMTTPEQSEEPPAYDGGPWMKGPFQPLLVILLAVVVLLIIYMMLVG